MNKMKMIKGAVFLTAFDNDLGAYVPEIWAAEALMVLEANMVMAGLVHRDFEDEIAEFGDVVNTRRPARFFANRKTDADNITIQDAIAENVQVPLDQHLHTSFIIKDGEESKGFQNLVTIFLVPAMWSIAQSIDEILLGQVYQFLGNTVGQLGVDPTRTSLIDIREIMNVNKAPQPGRNLVITPATEGSLLDQDTFIEADKVGDDGTALREASLGRKLGYNIFMAQNTPSISSANVLEIGAVNNAAGYAAGTTVLTVDAFTGAIPDGSWLAIAGDLTPQMVTATVGGATPTAITITPGLRNAVVDNASVTVYNTGEVNNAGGYAAGFSKSITIDGLAESPAVGQLISFGTATDVYSNIRTSSDPSITGVTLNRTLDAAIADDDVVGLGPDGNYNFAFNREALALVSRPLATPISGTGALSAVQSFNDLSIRVTITYDGNAQGHLVTVDLLCGVKTLDTDLGAVLLG